MSDLYSYKGAYPYALPVDTSQYNLDDFVIAPEKPALGYDEKLDWNGSSWIVRKSTYAETEIKGMEVREVRNNMLSASDIHVVRSYELGISVPVEIIQYRQSLRDITNQQGFPWYVVWPVM